MEDMEMQTAAEVAEENVTVETEEAPQSMDDISEELEASLKAGPPRDDDPIWEKFEKLLETKEIISVKIEDVVKGGVITMLDEVRGFIPASKLAAGFVENLEEFKGKTIDAIVITAERAGKKLVLSGRDVALMKQRAEKAAAQAAIEVGAVLEGIVDSLKDYGAFINLEGGLSGLLHVSQISYKRVEKPADALKKGDAVKVKVIGNKDGKISLSMKALEEAPVREKKPERPEGERTERRGRREREESVNYTEAEKATTSLKDILSGIKLD